MHTEGFTPFAKERLLYPSGHAKDTKIREYIMGGSTTTLTTRSLHGTVLTAWLDYAAHDTFTLLWVQFKGKRRLVHRKGTVTEGA